MVHKKLKIAYTYLKDFYGFKRDFFRQPHCFNVSVLFRFFEIALIVKFVVAHDLCWLLIPVGLKFVSAHIMILKWKKKNSHQKII